MSSLLTSKYPRCFMEGVRLSVKGVKFDDLLQRAG